MDAATAASQSKLPAVAAVVVAIGFVLMAAAFGVYDWFVHRRNRKVVGAAARSGAIVSSLFPSSVRDRLYNDQDQQHQQNQQQMRKMSANTAATVKTYLNKNEEEQQEQEQQKKPIADLFPATTIMFADIAGFTAWSSVREPSQVFVLLETLYAAFDMIAKKRRVFKVETIGDCYVAVTGLPDPRDDHAVAMSKFARDCMHRAYALTKKLEVMLGPDTSDLMMRMGLHSGPVTAGVLRGEKSRFQLFGDTMNTASRMESNGKKGRVQISQETADLLIAADKSHWIKAREEKIVAKGKGELQTYWLELGDRTRDPSSSRHVSSAASQGGSSQIDLVPEETRPDPATQTPTGEPRFVSRSRAQRMIAWNTEVLQRLLKQIVARRTGRSWMLAPHHPQQQKNLAAANEAAWHSHARGQTVLSEVREIIMLPTVDPVEEAQRQQPNPDDIVLDSIVVEQLRNLVGKIASLYRDNPFHNFEHASHVTLSIVKLMSRIVRRPNNNKLSTRENPSAEEDRQSLCANYPGSSHFFVPAQPPCGGVGGKEEDHTFGITSDPLTQFAIVLSALIHDVDHRGVPNSTLVKENADIAIRYGEKSVLEQNSVDLAWDLLMSHDYDALRGALYQTEAELRRFRHLIVNSVMATDIVDEELQQLRMDRWRKAFSDLPTSLHGSRSETNRKATLVIEHLIEASDVAHTMQHWHIYRKWNQKLFMECCLAHKDGRVDCTNPADYWYTRELSFFDQYVIPLARKLKQCGVFGATGDEYLNYAEKNRSEWAARGNEIVDEMVEEAYSTLGMQAEV